MGAILTERQHGSGISAQALRRHEPHRRQGRFRITKDERSSRIGADLIDCGVDGSGHGGRPVGEPPSFLATCPSVSGTVRHCSTGRSKVCRTPASRPCGGACFGEGVVGLSAVKNARGIPAARDAQKMPRRKPAGASGLLARLSIRERFCWCLLYRCAQHRGQPARAHRQPFRFAGQVVLLELGEPRRVFRCEHLHRLDGLGL